MNTKHQTITKKDGFTIIEVVLVLAIAGLIFLMVFIALPNLQRGQRDTQRKSDLARIATQIQNYQSNSRGAIPDSSNFSTFVQSYLGASGTPLKAGSEYSDPKNGPYTFSTASPASLAGGTIYYDIAKKCGTDGALDPSTVSLRQYTLRTLLEGSKSPFCLDNN